MDFFKTVDGVSTGTKQSILVIYISFLFSAEPFVVVPWFYFLSSWIKPYSIIVLWIIRAAQ